MLKKKAGAFAVVVASIALLAGLLAIIGCTPGGSASTGAQDAQAAQDETVSYEVGSMDYWINSYPMQYESALGYTVRDGVKHGHYGIGLRVLAPLARESTGRESTNFATTEDGYYQISDFHYDPVSKQWVIDGSGLDLAIQETRIRQGCFSCKSSIFNDVYAEDGASSFNALLTDDFLSIAEGNVWDCNLCHMDSTDGSSYDSSSAYFKELAGAAYDTLTPGERVCGQCHNEFGGYRAMLKTDEDFKNAKPWRYGLDVDSVLQAMIEDGLATTDEATGIVKYSAGHADVEIFQGSIHESLGMTCVDCHMATISDEKTGEKISNHDASGSPLESKETLEYCLTCHKDQGIKTTDEMASMVRSLQKETAANEEVVRKKLDTLYGQVLQAVQNPNSVDEETLNMARESYTKALAYVTWAESKASVGAPYIHDGGKVVHDPEEVASLVSRANKLLDDAIASLPQAS